MELLPVQNLFLESIAKHVPLRPIVFLITKKNYTNRIKYPKLLISKVT